MDVKKPEFTEKQAQLIKAYVAIVRKKKCRPTRADMHDAGFKNDPVRRAFNSISNLHKICKSLHPEVFENIVDEDLFTPRMFKQLKEEASKFKKFFVTTAVVGCQVDKNFLANIEDYCKRNDALLLIQPSADPAAVVGWTLDPVLAGKKIVFSDLSLNQNLFLSAIKISAKHIDPITGLGRIGRRNGSFIYASPKQRLKMVPTMSGKIPVALMTTGALTKPEYSTNRYMSERTAYIADNDHVMGGIIIEIEDNKTFHFRQVQADRSGGFVDLGKFYSEGTVTELKPDALIMGDFHSGQTDPKAEKAWLEIIRELKPKYAVFHDLLDSRSISHHLGGKNLVKAMLAGSNKLLLRDEVALVAADLNKFTPLAEVIVVRSNHDEHLTKWLDETRFIDEPHNLSYGLELARVMVEGRDPIAYAIVNAGLKSPNKVRFLKRDEEFKLARIECGQHGDKGSNGSRGNLRSMEAAFGNSVSGHNHGMEILRGAWQVGTSSYLQLDYNIGPSSWTQTSCLVYPNGSRQLISVVGKKGTWRA